MLTCILFLLPSPWSICNDILAWLGWLVWDRQTDCYSFLITLDPLPVPCGGTLSLFFSFSFLSTNFNAYWLAWLVSLFSNVTSSTHQNNTTPPFLSLQPTFLCLYCILLLFSLFASFNPCTTFFLSFL